MNKFDQLHSLCRRGSGPHWLTPSIRGAVAKRISPAVLRPFGASVRKRSALLQGPNDTFGVPERNHDDDGTNMSNRPAKFTQSDAKRLFKAAANAGVNVRVEFHPDGTIIASTGNRVTELFPNDADTDLDKWMKKHHENPT
jgi:hypothetical protein